MLTMNTKVKANILNEQFQITFTTESFAFPIPVTIPSSHVETNSIKISEKVINKLLHNINP